RHRPQRVRPDLQLHALHAEHPLVLFQQGVLGLGKYFDQRFLVEFIQSGHHRQAADELRNQAVLDQILRLHFLQHFADVLAVVLAPDLGAETDPALVGALADDLVQSVEGAAADEQDIRRIDLDEFLVRMLAAALRRNRGDRPLDQFQQSLLHALARDVAGDRGVVGLAGDLVDLVDVDDAALRLVDVVVALLQQLLDDVLHVLADVTRLGERGRVRHDERHVEQPRQRLCEQRLARPGGADQQDIRFRELDVVLLLRRLQPLVVVVDRYREDFLGGVLTDHVLVQDVTDLVRHRQIGLGALAGNFGVALFPDDVIAQLDALVADEYRGTGDELAYLVLTLAAEGAVEELFTARFVRHIRLSPHTPIRSDIAQVTSSGPRRARMAPPQPPAAGKRCSEITRPRPPSLRG